MFNDIREQAIYYQRLTFAGDMTQDNHARAVRNADAAQDGLAKRAQIVVGKISELEDAYPC